MLKISHVFGGVLLVAGTTIGAGMLALPVMSGYVGLFPSVCIFCICWLVMLATAFFLLDVTVSMKEDTNLISMAKRTLGPWGQGVSWVVYLLLLYALTAAYIAASAPLFSSATQLITGWTLPKWLALFGLPLVFGCFVYLGTVGVDVVNRLLMLGLAAAYVLLAGFLPEHIELDRLTHSDWHPALLVFPVVITSFGYHIIIPSLTRYMNQDVKKLRWILIWGSLIPLLIYILWQILILGVVPLEGKVSLIQAWKKGQSATIPLTHLLQSQWMSTGAHLFSFFAVVTSFLGVTLSLSDFLTDGFQIKKSWEGRLLACLLTFIPPLIFVFAYQRGFFVALEYAGVFVAILLIFLPALMIWKLKTQGFYASLLGRTLLIGVMAFAIFIVVVDILQQSGMLAPLISRYSV